ncbi:MAG: bifunctional oligoribonuclease/PAP phosphatase NrnA [Eubacterium sp.]|nr:bifunctional oligoribonuclease/PAP phosphatase NrnA [Eubacterium sp.]
MKKIISDLIRQSNSIAIGGHVRPDGDCVGSCMGMYSYIAEHFPDKVVDVYLTDIPAAFDFIVCDEALEHGHQGDYDLYIAQDCGDVDRLEGSIEKFQSAKNTICIDHHISNTEFADHNYVVPEASSASELICTLLPIEEMSEFTAKALYTGIIHDTGVFRHSCTGRQTMEIAGKLIEKGFDFGKIIDESFYQKTYKQLKCMGYCLENAVSEYDGKLCYAVADYEFINSTGATSEHFEGTIDQMRTTEGVEVALLITEYNPGEVKVSMRSNQYVDVSKIAVANGGGGHVRAAGATIRKPIDEALATVKELIWTEL